MKDTAEVGKLILRLREKLETVTDELTKNAADSKNGEVMKGCTDFLVKEAERLVAIQDGILKSTENFSELPPVRLVEPAMMFGGGVPDNLISRAGDASGIEMGGGERLAIEGPPVSMVATTTDATSSVSEKTDRTWRARSAKSHDMSRIRTGLPNIRSYPVQKSHPAESTNPIPVTHDDVDKGILNMIERGIIPPAAHIQLLPSPITKGHANAKRSADEDVENNASAGFYHEDHPNIKVDPNYTMSSDDYSKYGEKSIKTLETPMPPPGTPAAKIRESSSMRLKKYSDISLKKGTIAVVIEVGGKMNYNEQLCVEDFGEALWKTIKRDILPKLVEISEDYAIPLIVFTYNGLRRCAETHEISFPIKLPLHKILTYLDNYNDIIRLMKKPGRQFTGEKRRKHLAALLITAAFKMRRDREFYLTHRRRQQSAGIVAISWVMFVRMRRCKRKLVEVRKEQLKSYHKRLRKMRLEWPIWVEQPKIIIHLPSLGFRRQIRFTIEDLERRQMSQMARLIDSTKPNTQVIFISAMPFTDDLQRYYNRLLGMTPAVHSSNPAELKDPEKVTRKFTVIVPETMNQFPTHCFNVAQHLKYSAEAMGRLKSLIKGQRAIIYPGYVCADTLSVADELDVPIYGSEPDLVQLYSGKSGSRRIFKAAKVETPPGDTDIYNYQQLVECLAEQVTAHPFIDEWLIKLDCQFDGRGTYIFNARKLPGIGQLRSECTRYGESRWRQKSFQQTMFNKILEQVPSTLRLATAGNKKTKKAYPTLDKFMSELGSQGGAIQAAPATKEMTNLTVDIEITPENKIKFVSTGDQFHSDRFDVWGWSMPQDSVEAIDLADTVGRIGQACIDREIVGPVKITFLTFFDSNQRQRLWATGLKLMASDLASMTQLAKFSTGADFDAMKGEFRVAVTSTEKVTREIQLEGVNNTIVTKKETRNEEVVKIEPRHAVVSTQLIHTNLAVLHYTVFFQTCRVHAIGIDVKNKVGTVFTLMDTVKRENMGMVTVEKTLSDAIQNVARNLYVLHNEISAPNMQGRTNFHDVLKNVDKVLEIISMNEEELKVEEKMRR